MSEPPQRTLKYAIEALRQRPLMFLRGGSVTELLVFLAGYSFGLDVARPDEFPHRGIGDFRTWLRQKLGRSEGGEVQDLLLAETGNDESAAFALFFDYWDTYQAERSASP